MELLLIRHARPVRVHDTTGQPDPELSELGGAQTAALVQALDTQQVDAIYTSPLQRARHTAQPLAEHRGLAVTVEPDLAELSAGERSYIPFEEIGQEAADQEFLNQWLRIYDAPAGSGALGEFRKRVDGAIDRIVREHPGQTVAVVCHGGVINAVATAVLGLDELLVFAPDYTSITRILAARDGRRSVRSVNEHGHLPG